MAKYIVNGHIELYSTSNLDKGRLDTSLRQVISYVDGNFKGSELTTLNSGYIYNTYKYNFVIETKDNPSSLQTRILQAFDYYSNSNLKYTYYRAFVDNSSITGSTRPQTPPKQSSGGNNTYTVQRGDTLSSIAGKFGTTWQNLAAINNISNPNLLNVGQTLTVVGTAKQPAGGNNTNPPSPGTPPGTPPPDDDEKDGLLDSIDWTTGLIFFAIVAIVMKRK